ETLDRRGALVSVQLQVLPGKLALPGVRRRLAVRKVLVAPGERGTLEAAPSGPLPFSFRGAPLLLPGRRRPPLAWEAPSPPSAHTPPHPRGRRAPRDGGRGH